MMGLMQQHALLISGLIEFAARYHGDTEIVSRRVEGDRHRSSWAQVRRRAMRLAHGLDAWGVERGERVATLAWNGYRHLELYYGVSGSGRVLHTVNPRLHPEQIAWIVNHAQDRVLAFDMSFAPIIQAVAPHCPGVRRWVALCDAQALPAELERAVPGLLSYEAWLAEQSDAPYAWPALDESEASSMCYTSGTTGNPKAVLYSHRSTVLHAMAAALPDVTGLSARDAVLPVVPMFHVNAWGVPYTAAMVGAKVVFPGPALDGASLFELMDQEDVSFSAGVPTVWLGLLARMQQEGRRPRSLARVLIGGSAAPLAMIQAFQDTWGVEVRHAWGMTEMSPLGTACAFKTKHASLDAQQRLQLQTSQGRPLYGVDMRIVDPAGAEVAWDGRSIGELQVRGPWVLADYYQSGQPSPLRDGWFPTGDVVSIDPDGYMRIVDRSKDVIKSGGEWISSIDIENVAMSHPAVAMAACVAVPHPKWDERPLLVVVRKPGAEVEARELLAFYEGKVAKWWIPDDVQFVEAIPLGATGKILKTRLREQLLELRTQA
ncbi:MAG: long-chain-fatty-acid--CoA ligase [Betaproteobacteria bacterium]|nr:long-chain-fatty-acid--CoA ligase [Betaproteobacteria bacterium]MBU6513270.1 long-chain-fatty-acid--CoA ligase [Betaproteobacteria bacterium]MDE1956224.1 long-chain-fatty-acid--CoA ligase [Betaproteobacteria bacterium]MDE2153602.1 long-chain-fatty-acid--CoA ligase [Betaproteobacteria bacterium]